MTETLLIIFMLVERFHIFIPAHLPREAQGDGAARVGIVLELPREGGYRINGTPAAAAELGPRLAAIFEHRSVRLLFVRVAPGRTYREFIAAADVARGVGAQAVALMPPPR